MDFFNTEFLCKKSNDDWTFEKYAAPDSFLQHSTLSGEHFA